MGAVETLIAAEGGKIDFGDYTLAVKAKKDGFEVDGDIYKVKTFGEITKLEKNGSFAYESVPGTAVHGFNYTENGVEFFVEGLQDSEVTVGLAENTEYEVFINSESIGRIKTNLGGKLTFSVELSDEAVEVKITEV